MSFTVRNRSPLYPGYGHIQIWHMSALFHVSPTPTSVYDIMSVTITGQQLKDLVRVGEQQMFAGTLFCTHTAARK
jgi:hypothetical protein